MKKAEMEIQALSALKEASEATTAAEKTEWLKVAQIWYGIQDGIKEIGDSPEPPTGFMAEYPAIKGETVRLVIRIKDDGSAQVICDPRFEQCYGADVETPSEAAAEAMAMLDKYGS